MDIQFQSTPGPLASAITKAVDSLGGDVPNGGTTADTVLTLSGTGTQHTVVYIFDNQTLLRTASVISLGTWELTATVELGRHAFTVRDALGGGDSAEWVINVAEAELELKPPTVVQAPDGTLNPMDAISGATVVVSYDDMQPTDTIGLSWNGLDNLVSTQPGNAIGSVTFTVPASAVAAVIGKTIPVLYAVVRNGVAKPSWELPLTVETLADSVLEAPRILQATDDLNLDVSALTGDADLTVRPWPFIEVEQQISLRFEGTKEDGTAYNWAHPTWQDFPIGSAGEPTTTVALGDLKALKDGSRLTLIFAVSFDGGLTKILFPLRTLSVAQRAFRFEGFEEATPMLLPVGSDLLFPSGLRLLVRKNVGVVPLHWAIVRASSQQDEHGFQYLSIEANSQPYSQGQFILDVPSNTVRFTVWAVDNEPALTLRVSFYYVDDGNSLNVRYDVPSEGRLPVEYTAPPGKKVRQLYIDGTSRGFGFIAFDSFRWAV